MTLCSYGSITFNGSAMHHPQVTVVTTLGKMIDRAVIPHQQSIPGPLVVEDVFLLDQVFVEEIQ